MTRRAERLSRELENSMVDCKGDICNTLYTELVSELPQFGRVPWDDMARNLQEYISTEGDNPWSAWLEGPSQENLDTVLQILCNMVHDAVKDTVRGHPIKRIRFMGNKTVQSSAPGNTSKWPLKPDFVTIEESASEEPGWRHFETLWEHKTSGDNKESNDLICRLMVRMCQGWRDCPFRRFGFGVIVQRTKFRPIIVDATGGCRFIQTDIVQETAKFIRFVASLLFLSRPYIGYDNISIPNEGSQIPLLFEGCQLIANEWPIACPTKDHLVGRGTHIYLARTRENPSSEPLLVVKDCWQQEGREKEENILRGLRGVPGVPPLLYEAAADPFNNTLKIRRGFDQYAKYDFTQQGYATSQESSIHGESSTHNITDEGGNTASRKRKGKFEDSSPHPRKRSCTIDKKPDYHITPRRHCRIVLPYCGAHLDATHHSDGVVMTDSERLRATRDVVNTIKDAFLHSQSTIHRDISLRNIAVWRPNRPHPHMDINGQAGFLLDWDMSNTLGPDWKPLKPNSGPDRTGTWYYMATNICQLNYDGLHLPWYDAESVFWVWLVLVLKRAGHWQENIKQLSAAGSLGSMCAIRTNLLLPDFWTEFRAHSGIHLLLRKLLSDLRTELFYDQGEGPTFKYVTSKWNHTKENVRVRFECLAGIFEKYATEFDKEENAIGPN